ncbi:MAG TPA: NlpC/P60 family protein [Streptomyces sp.]|nr:NlpC/P60 family protein [Streptomyces sp.]
MIDGRKRHHARTAAAVTAVIATMSLGLTMSPAAAAPDTNDIDSAQARVDKLSAKAEAAAQRHEKAASRLAKAKTQLRRTTTSLRHNERLIDTLRSQVAGTAVDEYDGGLGTAAPTASLPLDPQVKKDSEALLANVVLVSEDAGARGDALARSNALVGQLSDRQTLLRNKIDLLARGEETSRSMERTASTRQDKAAATLSELEAQRIAALGGPAVAYAKAQVGKSYVYGAAGPDAFDCSGLTMAAWSQAGVSLPHSSSAQYSSGPHISESELQPGDLVFYYSPISHVGMYIGNGQIVNALNPGAGVVISGLHDMPYSGAVRPGG